MYFLTSRPLARPCMSILKRKLWPSPSWCLLGSHGLQEAVPKPMDGGCGWSWCQERTAPSSWSQEQWHTLYLCCWTFFFSFLLPASRWLCPNCLLPIAGCTNPWATPRTEPESASQKPPQGQCSRVGHGRPAQCMKPWFYLWAHMEFGCFLGPNPKAHLILCWTELLWKQCGISSG